MRKFEYETGHFISIDPLWAKYYGWSPYQYSMNSSVMLVDGNGNAFGLASFNSEELNIYTNHAILDLNLSSIGRNLSDQIFGTRVLITVYESHDPTIRGTTSSPDAENSYGKGPDNGKLKWINIGINLEKFRSFNPKERTVSRDEFAKVFYEELYHASELLPIANNPEALSQYFDYLIKYQDVNSPFYLPYEKRPYETWAKKKTNALINSINEDEQEKVETVGEKK